MKIHSISALGWYKYKYTPPAATNSPWLSLSCSSYNFIKDTSCTVIKNTSFYYWQITIAIMPDKKKTQNGTLVRVIDVHGVTAACRLYRVIRHRGAVMCAHAAVAVLGFELKPRPNMVLSRESMQPWRHWVSQIQSTFAALRNVCYW